MEYYVVEIIMLYGCYIAHHIHVILICTYVDDVLSFQHNPSSLALIVSHKSPMDTIQKYPIRVHIRSGYYVNQLNFFTNIVDSHSYYSYINILMLWIEYPICTFGRKDMFNKENFQLFLSQLIFWMSSQHTHKHKHKHNIIVYIPFAFPSAIVVAICSICHTPCSLPSASPQPSRFQTVSHSKLCGTPLILITYFCISSHSQFRIYSETRMKSGNKE